MADGIAVNVKNICANVVNAITFQNKRRYRHDLLLCVRNVKPRAEHWTLKCVWNASSSKKLHSTDLLVDGDVYICVNQKEDNLDVDQLLDRFKTFMHHYNTIVCITVEYLTRLENRFIPGAGELSSCTKNASIWTRASTACTTVVVVRKFTPEDMSVMSTRTNPDSTTTTRITLSDDCVITTHASRESIRKCHGIGRCYHSHSMVAVDGSTSKIFESYEGPVRITDKCALQYHGRGGVLRVMCAFNVHRRMGGTSPVVVFTTIHGSFDHGVPHGDVNIWIAWSDGRGYTYKGALNHGQKASFPTPRIVQTCPSALHTSCTSVDHENKLFTFAKDKRECWCAAGSPILDIDAHLRWAILDCRPASEYLI
jgi:hypothetical protein